MFEKEAEELIEESKRLNTTPRETVRKAIEFGFQKGIKARINTTTISDCPIKDRWHFVKDGDLPINKNDGTTYLLYTIYGEGGSPVVAHFAYRDKQELMNIWTGAILTEDKIVAWKEIVPPEEED